MGRPFAVDADFAIHLHIRYYAHVAPLVKLWLFEIKREIARRDVAAEFEREAGGIAASHNDAPAVAYVALLELVVWLPL